MPARCVMVLGTTSGAGKSWLATALCRWYARQGLRVAPFKAQNMSNNARVVAGGEIGSAQYFQALAAGVEPTVQMNPLLLKPEADTRSQVILLGQVSPELTAMPWRSRHRHTWPVIAGALDELRRHHEVIVIEGAGSPAEINLQGTDVVNMRVARHAGAACLLVCDIDRGGAFAHLYGTWALMPEEDRKLLKGFVLNRFRGDASLLAPAPQMIEAMTGVPVVATVPMWTGHGLPEEDGWLSYRDADPWGDAGGAGSRLQIVLVAPPRISNLDEFEPLSSVAGVRLVVVRSGASLPALGRHDWIILPGSKHTGSDLAWLRRQHIDGWVQAHAAAGGAVLGICGGLQMLGELLADEQGGDGVMPGLGLLPLHTVFAGDKVLSRRTWRLGALPAGPWEALSEVNVSAYEIHQGRTTVCTGERSAWAGDEHSLGHGTAPGHDQVGKCAAAITDHDDIRRMGAGQDTDGALPSPKGQGAHDLWPVLPEGLGWCNAAGNVLGVYVHGLFENESVLQALFGQRARSMTAVFDGLAGHLEASVAPGVLAGLLR
ncbi:MAG: cobyric acid synthase [Lautropia sp.]|nr:cobyric acid synthase [Lautropia sp.]